MADCSPCYDCYTTILRKHVCERPLNDLRSEYYKQKKVLQFFVFVLSADRYSVITCLHVLVLVSVSIDHVSLCCQFESTWGMYLYFRNRKRIPVGCFPIDQISSGLNFRVFHATNGIVFSAWLDQPVPGHPRFRVSLENTKSNGGLCLFTTFCLLKERNLGKYREWRLSLSTFQCFETFCAKIR